MASLASPSRQQPVAAQQSQALSRSALKARDALVLEHLPLADAIASATARRLFPLVEREDLIQVAREALVRSAPRCRAGEPPAPYLRRCITGALQHHLRDRVRLVRVPRRIHEQGACPLRHLSLDATADGELCLLDQLASPEAASPSFGAEQQLALEQLVDQLPAAQATALRLTILEGLSLRAALGADSMALLSAAASPFCRPEEDPFLLLESTLRSVEEILLRRRGLALRRTWIEQPYGEEEITLLEEEVIPAIQQCLARIDELDERLLAEQELLRRSQLEAQRRLMLA